MPVEGFLIRVKSTVAQADRPFSVFRLLFLLVRSRLPGEVLILLFKSNDQSDATGVYVRIEHVVSRTLPASTFMCVRSFKLSERAHVTPTAE